MFATLARPSSILPKNSYHCGSTWLRSLVDPTRPRIPFKKWIWVNTKGGSSAILESVYLPAGLARVAGWFFAEGAAVERVITVVLRLDAVVTV